MKHQLFADEPIRTRLARCPVGWQLSKTAVLFPLWTLERMRGALRTAVLPLRTLVRTHTFYFDEFC